MAVEGGVSGRQVVGSAMGVRSTVTINRFCDQSTSVLHHSRTFLRHWLLHLLRDAGILLRHSLQALRPVVYSRSPLLQRTESMGRMRDWGGEEVACGVEQKIIQVSDWRLVLIVLTNGKEATSYER